jgi:hypothetical protein
MHNNIEILDSETSFFAMQAGKVVFPSYVWVSCTF